MTKKNNELKIRWISFILRKVKATTVTSRIFVRLVSVYFLLFFVIVFSVTIKSGWSKLASLLKIVNKYALRRREWAPNEFHRFIEIGFHFTFLCEFDLLHKTTSIDRNNKQIAKSVLFSHWMRTYSYKDSCNLNDPKNVQIRSCCCCCCYFLWRHLEFFAKRRVDSNRLSTIVFASYSNYEHTAWNWGVHFFLNWPVGLMPIFCTKVMWCLGGHTQWTIFFFILMVNLCLNLTLLVEIDEMRVLYSKVLRRFFLLLFRSLVNGIRNNMKSVKKKLMSHLLFYSRRESHAIYAKCTGSWDLISHCLSCSVNYWKTKIKSKRV